MVRDGFDRLYQPGLQENMVFQYLNRENPGAFVIHNLPPSPQGARYMLHVKGQSDIMRHELATHPERGTYLRFSEFLEANLPKLIERLVHSTERLVVFGIPVSLSPPRGAPMPMMQPQQQQQQQQQQQDDDDVNYGELDEEEDYGVMDDHTRRGMPPPAAPDDDDIAYGAIDGDDDEDSDEDYGPAPTHGGGAPPVPALPPARRGNDEDDTNYGQGDDDEYVGPWRCPCLSHAFSLFPFSLKHAQPCTQTYTHMYTHVYNHTEQRESTGKGERQTGEERARGERERERDGRGEREREREIYSLTLSYNHTTVCVVPYTVTTMRMATRKITAK